MTANRFVSHLRLAFAGTEGTGTTCTDACEEYAHITSSTPESKLWVSALFTTLQ
jgi:hypothetical protein